MQLPALIWKPSPNFTKGRAGKAISLIVIHDTEGGFAGSVSWLDQFRSHVSAHLVLSEDGKSCDQLVAFADKAWHACWFNTGSIGIEMAGFAAKGFADAEWCAAASITAYLCHRFAIPIRWAQAGKGAGIARHYDLGRLGGGHKDPCTEDGNAADGKWHFFLGQVAKIADEMQHIAMVAPWGR